MPVNVSTTIKKNQITVFVIPSKSYQNKIGEISKALADLKKKVCYVSLNKPYKSIRDRLKEAGTSAEDFYFVDAVSSKVGSVESTEKVVFVSSPRALTELNIAITKCLGLWKPDVVLFDSLSTLLVYEGASSVLRFVHSVASNLRVKGKSCVFTVLKEDLQNELSKDLGMFADSIEELK